MALVVYTLCTMVSILCYLLLWRAYKRTRLQLLMWSAAFFLIFGLANGMLFADLILFPDTDFTTQRNLMSLIAVLVLLYGLIFESS